jgi:hypothetical protein
MEGIGGWFRLAAPTRPAKASGDGGSPGNAGSPAFLSFRIKKLFFLA